MPANELIRDGPYSSKGIQYRSSRVKNDLSLIHYIAGRRVA